MRKEKRWTRKQYEHCYRTMRRKNVANENPLLIGIHADIIDAAYYSYQAKDYFVTGWVNDRRRNEFIQKIVGNRHSYWSIPF